MESQKSPLYVVMLHVKKNQLSGFIEFNRIKLAKIFFLNLTIFQRFTMKHRGAVSIRVEQNVIVQH